MNERTTAPAGLPSAGLPHAPALDTDPNAPGDLAAFKNAFRRHAAGVAVVTALDAQGKPVGFTATSLASMSAVPPLATFNMAKSASSWPAINETERVVIHLLGLRNRTLAERLAGPNAERFVGDHWRVGPYGLPVLNNVTSWMVGRIVERVTVHNSAVVVVQIEGGGLGDDDEALIYHERQYRALGETL
ncbi:flavin oxidoreductase [Cryobacterium sp. LW097]|uniref:flavin reductase family protein n=1 Tax=unclassified Cryobacterium TaxID=2649013 RepID=UPI000B4CD5C2|nr:MULTISPECIES: flavin reductase family protein [unclassified Cryobacterium]ASD22005.1 flavin oxidoreductase [Cryobacterium sp. LW097]TFC53421.1 flavin reductase [Cryobacterium sp. TMB3-1-2]TFC62005.1 flavin reductase [Cryobacterium sp. TMB1-7]TFC69086.1 flavin reductase [Cryobacterium sp. TMB3-15]TFC76114.1 flavin reductase [Cryobacterium sp. TMB3-10]